MSRHRLELSYASARPLLQTHQRKHAYLTSRISWNLPSSLSMWDSLRKTLSSSNRRRFLLRLASVVPCTGIGVKKTRVGNLEPTLQPCSMPLLTVKSPRSPPRRLHLTKEAVCTETLSHLQVGSQATAPSEPDSSTREILLWKPTWWLYMSNRKSSTRRSRGAAYLSALD